MAKWQHKLPDVLEPETTICVKVNIPAHPDYVALFVRAVRMLETQRQYERDETLEGAKIVAAQFRDRTITPLIEALASETDYCNVIENCQDIADCIDDPESPSHTSVTNISNINIDENNTIINQDRNLTPDANGFLEKRFKSLDRDEPILEPVGTCNDSRKDEIYAGILEIVTRVAEMAQDFLEDVNSTADNVQRAARAVAIVPIIGDLAGETILAFAEVVPDILNLYLSYDSLVVHEDVACDLFCLHADECGYPTFDELLDYYGSAGIFSAGNIQDLSMRALVDAVLGTNGLAAAVCWHAMNTFVLYFMMVESNFFGRRGKKWIQIYASNGELLPNNDWMILCDACAPAPESWAWSYAATTCTYGLPTGWDLNIGAASCGNGVGAFDGIYRTRNGVAAEVIALITMPFAQAVYEVHVNAICNLVTGFSDGTLNVKVFNGATEVFDASQTLPRTGFTVHDFAPNVIGTSIRIYGVQNYLSQNPTGICFNKISVNEALP